MKYLMCLFVSSLAFAKVVHFGDGRELVRILYGQETVLRFPSDVKMITGAQRFIIKPADKMQPSYSTLTVEPRFSSGSSQVVFLLSDGTNIHTKFVIVPQGLPDMADTLYEFKSKESLLSDRERLSGDVSSVDLLKAMIRGEGAQGYVIKNVSREITPGFSGVTTKIIRIYTGERFHGYIFEIVNQSKEPLSLNVQNLMIGDPNVALLSYTDRDILEPEKSERGRSILYTVARALKNYNQLILPIETVEKR